jgi:hypothetical protein
MLNVLSVPNAPNAPNAPKEDTEAMIDAETEIEEVEAVLPVSVENNFLLKIVF